MIEVKHEASAQRFTARIEGHSAQLDYEVSGGTMTITHTGVPEAIGGRGVAAELTRAALALAREHGWQVIPACSYAAAYLAKHPQPAPPAEGAAARRHQDALLDESLEESFPASDPPSMGRSS